MPYFALGTKGTTRGAIGTMNAESLIMKICRRLHLRKLRWSLRRLHCPVGKEALVLEVGAGGNPYPRANVLLDAEEVSLERMEKDLIRDRPLVLGIAERLPFKDKSFDFIIASHILEHSDDPVAFLSELMRVGKAGYIETPEGWFEKMCPFTFHRLEVSQERGKLLITKKAEWKPDPIARLYENRLSGDRDFSNFLRINPDLNHMRFFWSTSIEFEITNPDVDASWPYPEEITESLHKHRKASLIDTVRNLYLNFRRRLFSQNSRNRSINVYEHLQCVDCTGSDLKKQEESLVCICCNRSYEIKNGMPVMFPSKPTGFVRRTV